MFARFIYAHPRYFVLLILCVLAVGLNSYQLIPRQEKPTLVNMLANVTTFYPGATPARVESLVTSPLEDEIRKIEEVDEIFSTSDTGVSSINVRLDDTLSDEGLERTWSEVRDAVADAAVLLPPGASDPAFESDRLTAFTSILAFSSAGKEDLPLSLLSRLAEEFARKARNMSGTRLVEIFGEPTEEVRVEVDQAELVSRGLSVRDVATALHAADVKVSSGRLAGAGHTHGKIEQAH